MHKDNVLVWKKAFEDKKCQVLTTTTENDALQTESVNCKVGESGRFKSSNTPTRCQGLV